MLRPTTNELNILTRNQAKLRNTAKTNTPKEKQGQGTQANKSIKNNSKKKDYK